MKLNVEYLDCCENLCKVAPDLFNSERGPRIIAEQSAEKSYVIQDKNPKQVEIRYAEKSDLLLAIGDILTDKCPDVEVEIPSPVMDFRAAMLDCSRNAVPKISTLKRFILEMALMGMNYCCLYTEDTYEVEGEVLVGYGRGKFTKRELRDLVDFAKSVGVTMFPCIQTLGHFEQILKYRHYNEYEDNNRVLDITKKKTYSFIEKFIKEATEPYETDLIHLGTDEPWGLGRGNALNLKKPTPPTKLYANHLKKLAGICKKLNKKGVIWGDYILGSSGEKALSEKEIDAIPKSLIMNYWEYEVQTQKKHKEKISVFQKNKFDTLISGGIHSWNNFWCDINKAVKSIAPLMKTAHNMEIKKSMITIWGDDGNECLLRNCTAALAYHFAYCRYKKFDDKYWKDKVGAVSGIPYESYALVAAVENAHIENKAGFESTAKQLFYDDPLMGYINRLHSANSVYDYFSDLAHRLRVRAPKYQHDRRRVLAASYFARIIALKFNLSRTARLAYLEDDLSRLKSVLGQLNELSKLINEFHNLYRILWNSERKPFGYEILDIRFGGMRSRITSFRTTLDNYLSGKIDRISEFALEPVEDLTECHDYHSYSNIISKCHSIW